MDIYFEEVAGYFKKEGCDGFFSFFPDGLDDSFRVFLILYSSV